MLSPAGGSSSHQQKPQRYHHSNTQQQQPATSHHSPKHRSKRDYRGGPPSPHHHPHHHRRAHHPHQQQHKSSRDHVSKASSSSPSSSSSSTGPASPSLPSSLFAREEEAFAAAASNRALSPLERILLHSASSPSSLQKEEEDVDTPEWAEQAQVRERLIQLLGGGALVWRFVLSSSPNSPAFLSSVAASLPTTTTTANDGEENGAKGEAEEEAAEELGSEDRAFFALPRSEQLQHLLSLWEGAALRRGHALFRDDLTLILSTHYPCLHKSLLDLLLAAFLLRHPEHVDVAVAALVSALCKQTSKKESELEKWNKGTEKREEETRRSEREEKEKEQDGENRHKRKRSMEEGEREGGKGRKESSSAGVGYNQKNAPFYALMVLFAESSTSPSSAMSDHDAISTGSYSSTIASSLPVCSEILIHLTKHYLRSFGGVNTNVNLNNEQREEAHHNDKASDLRLWLVDCLRNAPDALREDHLRLILNHVLDTSSYNNHDEEEKEAGYHREEKDKIKKGKLMEKKSGFPLVVGTSSMPHSLVFRKLQGLVLLEWNKYQSLSIAQNLVPLLLSFQQQHLLLRRSNTPSFFSHSTPSSSSASSTPEDLSASLMKTASQTGYLLPFQRTFLLYFTRLQSNHTHDLIRRLLALSPAALVQQTLFISSSSSFSSSSSPTKRRYFPFPIFGDEYDSFICDVNADEEDNEKLLGRKRRSSGRGYLMKAEDEEAVIFALFDFLWELFSSDGQHGTIKTEKEKEEDKKRRKVTLSSAQQKQEDDRQNLVIRIERNRWFHDHFLRPLLQFIEEERLVGNVCGPEVKADKEEEEQLHSSSFSQRESNSNHKGPNKAERLLRRVFVDSKYSALLFGIDETEADVSAYNGEKKNAEEGMMNVETTETKVKENDFNAKKRNEEKRLKVERERARLMFSLLEALQKLDKGVQSVILRLWEQAWTIPSSPNSSFSLLPSLPPRASSYAKNEENSSQMALRYLSSIACIPFYLQSSTSTPKNKPSATLSTQEQKERAEKRPNWSRLSTFLSITASCFSHHPPFRRLLLNIFSLFLRLLHQTRNQEKVDTSTIYRAVTRFFFITSSDITEQQRPHNKISSALSSSSSSSTPFASSLPFSSSSSSLTGGEVEVERRRHDVWLDLFLLFLRHAATIDSNEAIAAKNVFRQSLIECLLELHNAMQTSAASAPSTAKAKLNKTLSLVLRTLQQGNDNPPPQLEQKQPVTKEEMEAMVVETRPEEDQTVIENEETTAARACLVEALVSADGLNALQVLMVGSAHDTSIQYTLLDIFHRLHDILHLHDRDNNDSNSSEVHSSLLEKQLRERLDTFWNERRHVEILMDELESDWPPLAERAETFLRVLLTERRRRSRQRKKQEQDMMLTENETNGEKQEDGLISCIVDRAWERICASSSSSSPPPPPPPPPATQYQQLTRGVVATTYVTLLYRIAAMFPSRAAAIAQKAGSLLYSTSPSSNEPEEREEDEEEEEDELFLPSPNLHVLELLGLLDGLKENDNDQDSKRFFVPTATVMRKALRHIRIHPTQVQQRQFELLAVLFTHIQEGEGEEEDQQQREEREQRVQLMVEKMPEVVEGLCSSSEAIRQLCSSLLRRLLSSSGDEQQRKTLEAAFRQHFDFAMRTATLRCHSSTLLYLGEASSSLFPVHLS
ncbi:hypothetical protein QOT17_001876 [Balamuthia mandrillaris]